MISLRNLLQYPLNFFNDMWHRMDSETPVERVKLKARKEKVKKPWVNHRARYRAIARRQRKVAVLDIVWRNAASEKLKTLPARRATKGRLTELVRKKAA